ncbi:MAG: FAD:protein FMN transferase [Candidatus Omnitrophica bacterium]|nr:FAD:protein FMN transferase [Candidatus Omnitrophota bacterium]
MSVKNILYKSVFIVICLAITVTLCLKTETRTRFKMGTFVDIVLTGFVWNDFGPVFDSAFLAIDSVEQIADMYDTGSQLSNLNRSACVGPFHADKELFAMIYHSDRLNRESDGVFDITIAPVAKLWKLCIHNKIMPDAKDIRDNLVLTGPGNLALNPESQEVFFKKKGMSIDLGAVAKGYAVDKAVSQIKISGIKSAMINAGGDIFCLGKKNLFSPWRVGIRDPYDKKNICEVISLSDKAAATSGGYEQFFMYEGKCYSHLIDPRTGYPSNGEYSSVTVIADSCFLADSLATAIFIGGEETRKKLLSLYPGIEVITIKSNF